MKSVQEKEGAALDEGDKGQEIVPVASASGGKEQEGYPGWCMRFPLSNPSTSHALYPALQYNGVKCVSPSVISLVPPVTSAVSTLDLSAVPEQEDQQSISELQLQPTIIFIID